MRLWCLGIVAFLVSGSVALGDGCYFPQRTVRKIPDIVAQRAVLSWKDGKETLVISSALDSEAQQLGWIIPVPAVPETIEKATPGSLKTLEFCIQPRITHDLFPAVQSMIVVMLIGNALIGTLLFRRRYFGCLAISVLFFFLLIRLMLPAGMSGSASAAKSSGVQVEKTATVGSYAISILRPSQPDGLDSWLAENGFAALPEAAGPIVADYASRGWVFAAIKLTRSESGANVPHPIKLAFASKEPIYPMKLTALAGGSPAFEVFVIGNDRASCGILPEEFCDRFSQETRYGDDPGEMQSWFSGQTTSCSVGHSAICSLMWDGCVLTKLAGKVDAAKMTDDIQFAWAPFKSHQDHYFTQSGAWSVAAIVFVMLIGVGNILSMWDYARGFIQPREFAWYCVSRLLPLSVFACLIAGAVFASLPKLDNADIQVSRWREYRLHSMGASCQALLDEHPDLLKRPEPEIAACLLKSLQDLAREDLPMKNPLTGGELTMEDSPGNFTIEKKMDRVVLRMYTGDGSIAIRTVPIPATGNDMNHTDSASGPKH